MSPTRHATAGHATARHALARHAGLTVLANAIVWTTLLTMSIRNSRATNAPGREILDAWAPTLWCPIIATLAATAFRALPLPKPARFVAAAFAFIAAGYGLVGRFDTGDGVCTYQLTTLTGTVRGACFQQPRMIAATLWSVAATAPVLMFTSRPTSPRAA